MTDELIDPLTQEQAIVDDHNNLVSQYPDVGANSVMSVSEIDDSKYKDLTLNDINAKRVLFENEFGIKVEPFTSLEDYQQRAPIIIDAVKKSHGNNPISVGEFNNRLAKSLSSQNDQSNDQSNDQVIRINDNAQNGNTLVEKPPVGGYGGDVPRETSGKVLEYKLGEAKRKELTTSHQMLSKAIRLRENNMLPDDQVKILNTLQNNMYSGFVPQGNDIGLSVFKTPDDTQLEEINKRAGNIAEGNLHESQQIGQELKQLQQSIDENYTSHNLATPPELISQTLELQSKWQDKRDKANLFASASKQGMIEDYNRKIDKGNLAGDFVISTVVGLNNLGKSVINTLATLSPSDLLSFTPFMDNPAQIDRLNKMFGYDQDKAKKWVQDFNTHNAEGLNHVMYDVFKLSTPEHKAAQGVIAKFISGIAEMLPPMAISMMADNPYISYSVWASNSYSNRIDEMTKDPRWENASLDEIKKAALPPSLAEAAIMETGIKDMKGSVGIASEDSHQIIYNILENASNHVIPNTGLTGLQKAIVEGTLKTTSGAITASGTGATVSMVNDISKNLYNTAMGDVSGLKTEKLADGSYNIINSKGDIIGNELTEDKANNWKKRYEPVSPMQIIENGVNSAKDWALMGTIMSVPMTAHAVLSGHKIDSRDFAFTKSLLEDNSKVNVLYTSIKNDLATGKIDKAEASNRITYLKDFKSIADQIPSNLTPKNQRTAFELLNNIKKLESQKAGKAEGLTGSIDRDIALNKQKLQEIGDAVQDKSKDSHDGESSYMPFTIQDKNNGVDYGMKFDNTMGMSGHNVKTDTKFSPIQMSDVLRDEYKKEFPDDIGIEEDNLQKLHDEGKAVFIKVNDTQGLYTVPNETSPNFKGLNGDIESAKKALEKDNEVIKNTPKSEIPIPTNSNEPQSVRQVEEKIFNLDSGKKEELSKLANEKIDKDNFYIATKTKWKRLKYGKQASELYNELKNKEGVEHVNSPQSQSQYLIDGDKVYRFSDHWGNIASVKWDLDKPLEEWQRKEFVLAESNFSDFKHLPKTDEDIAKAYHKAKTDGGNPELVKAVEQSLKETPKAETTNNVGKESVIQTKESTDVSNKIKQLEIERDAEIDKITLPKIKLDLISSKDLVNSEDPISNKERHDDIKDRYKKLIQLKDCLLLLWSTQ